MVTFCKWNGEQDGKKTLQNKWVELQAQVGEQARCPHGCVGTRCMHAVDKVTMGERVSRGASMVNAHWMWGCLGTSNGTPGPGRRRRVSSWGHPEA